MNNQKLSQIIDFLVEIDKLKEIYRTTLLLDGSRQENDAEHMWHMAIAAMVLQGYSNHKRLDIVRVLKMALLHDVVELDTGDTHPYGNNSLEEKLKKEKQAAQRIFGMLPDDLAKEFTELWNEYENCKTPESKFAQALDSFMPILHNYKTKGRQWQRLNVTAEQVLSRNKRIKEGSNELWDFINTIMLDAVEKKYLTK